MNYELTKEAMTATLRNLLHDPVRSVKIHGHRIMIAAPELSDVFRDHLKEREAMLRRELKNIEHVRDGFESGSRAIVSARLKQKHART
jgi:TATA-binding protein-associated factor Taf7